MSRPEWHIRSGQPSDRALLAVFEVEVEQFIRTQLIDWAFDPHAADRRLMTEHRPRTQDNDHS